MPSASHVAARATPKAVGTGTHHCPEMCCRVSGRLSHGGAKHPLGCSIAKRGWSCLVSAGRASRGGLLAEQGVAAGPAGSLCQTPVWERCGVCTALGCGRAEQLAMQLCHAGLGSGKARNSRGVTSSAFRLSSTCVCESTPLFFCETGCTRPPTGMVIKRETFI